MSIRGLSEWGDMSIRGLLFQRTSTIQIQLSVLVKYKTDIIILSLIFNVFSPWYSWQIAELALNNNHPLTHSLFSIWLVISGSFSYNSSLPYYFSLNIQVIINIDLSQCRLHENLLCKHILVKNNKVITMFAWLNINQLGTKSTVNI
jgi:hypothetical protein